MGDFKVFEGIPESYMSLTDFHFWAEALNERAMDSRDWCETKAVTWTQKLQTHLDRVKEYPAISRAFVPFLEAVAKQESDVEKDTTICLVVAKALLKFSERSEEKEMMIILRKLHQSTRHAYIQAYRRSDIWCKIYKDSLLRLKSFLGNRGIPVTYIELLHRAIARDAAKELVKALELELALRANVTTVSEKYEYVAKQTAVKKVQYFLDEWRSQFSRHSNHVSISSIENTGNPYLETYQRMVGIDTHDVVNKLFEHSFERCNITNLSMNIDVGIDIRDVLGFTPKVKPLAKMNKDKKSYLESSGLDDSIFVPLGFKWHGVDEDKVQPKHSSDMLTPIKREVVVVHDHAARGNHEITIKKGMLIQQLTEANELGLALGCYRSSFPFKEIKAGFFPVRCVKSEHRHVPKKSFRRH